MNACAKIFEKAVYNVVSPHVEPLITAFQHGFRPKRSTTSNLITYTEFLCKSMTNGGQSDTLYTDFSKAFDKVPHNLLIRKLKWFGVGNTMLKWFKSYLVGRIQYVRIGNETAKGISPSSGVPQGSILGSLLFIIFINDLPESILSQCLMFADDLTIFRNINSIRDCIALQRDLDQLHIWCVTNGLTLNVRKCSVVSFTRSASPIIFDYQAGSTLLNRSHQVDDLGIRFDSKLKFDHHIQMITKKAFRSLGFIARNTKQFKNPESSILLFNTYVRSTLEYANQVWNRMSTY